MLRDNLVRPLRGMQLIEPQERVWIGQSLAVVAGEVALVVEPGDVGRGSEIFVRVVVNVGNLESQSDEIKSNQLEFNVMSLPKSTYP